MVEEARDALGERYPHSIRRFLEAGGKRIDLLHSEARPGGHCETIAFEAHAFKSSSACLGAAQFPKYAATLEMEARKLKDGGDASSLAPLVSELSDAFDALARAMLTEIGEDEQGGSRAQGAA
jgi:HPt (histidine-containing phosphotransfer) domain-containing protein